MKAIIILIEMIFLHYIADYQIQGCLSKLKTSKWWKDKTINHSVYTKVTDCQKLLEKCKDDYKAALFAHAFEWAFIVMLPMLYWVDYEFYKIGHVLLYLFLFNGNLWAHYMIDDWRSNKHKINLMTDQCAHFTQIFITWLLWWAFIGWH